MEEKLMTENILDKLAEVKKRVYEESMIFRPNPFLTMTEEEFKKWLKNYLNGPKFRGDYDDKD